MDKQSNLAGLEPLFAVPFSREQLRLDLQNIFLAEMRKLRHMWAFDAVLPLQASVKNSQFWNPSCSPEEIGITYAQVSNFALAQACEDYYDFGIYAVAGSRSEPLKFDSIHTWIGAFLVDLSRSSYFEEWDAGEGHDGLRDSVKRCTFLCELANARVILEGGEYLYHFSGLEIDEDSDLPGLSIRQLALLAGMEEMSLRSYISRKTSPALEVCKKERNTYVAIHVAKQWLIEKGRYRPVQAGRTFAEVDLTTTSFENFNAFTGMLQSRAELLAQRSTNREELDQALLATLKAFGVQNLAELEPEAGLNINLIERLATLLELPLGPFGYRAKETYLKTKLQTYQQDLKYLQQQAIS